MKFLSFFMTLLLLHQIAKGQSQAIVIDTTNSGIPSNLVSSLFFDANDYLWVGTNDKGLGVFDGVKWTYYNTSNTADLKSDYINDIKQHPNGDMWFGTGLGIAVLSKGNWTFYDTTQINYYPLFYQLYIQFDSKGNAYTLSQGGTSGKPKIYKYENGKWTLILDDNSNSFTNFIPSGYPRDFAIDKNDVLWTKGGYFYDGSKWTKAARPSNLEDYYDGGIAVDDNNNVWFILYDLNRVKTTIPVKWDGSVMTTYDSIGSSGSFNTADMMVRLNPYTKDIWYLNINAIPGNKSRGICEWFDGTRWHHDNKLDEVLDSAGYPFYSNYTIKSVSFDKRDNVWLGMNNSGEYRKQYADNGGIIIYNENGVDLNNFPVGISKFTKKENRIIIYPNPSISQVKISVVNKGKSDLQITDASGSLILQDQFYASDYNFNVAHWNAGLYLVHVKNDGQSITQRLMVTK